MAVSTYSIDGGTAIPGVRSTWQRIPVRKAADGQTSYSNYAINRWQLALMSMTDFETLRATQGEALASLETNDIDDQDNDATYTTAYVGLVAGRQNGTQMTNVTIEFRVKVV